MHWEILGPLGEIIGGLGVIFSFLYLAPQINEAAGNASTQTAGLSQEEHSHAIPLDRHRVPLI
jgi:hypothetical protein